MRTTAAVILLGLGLGMVHGSAKTSERRLSYIWKQLRGDDGTDGGGDDDGCPINQQKGLGDLCVCIKGTRPPTAADGDGDGCVPCGNDTYNDGTVPCKPCDKLECETHGQCKDHSLQQLFDFFPDLPTFDLDFQEALAKFRESKPAGSRRLSDGDKFHYEFEDGEGFEETKVCKLGEKCHYNKIPCSGGSDPPLTVYTENCEDDKDKERYCDWPDRLAELFGARTTDCDGGRQKCTKCQTCVRKPIKQSTCKPNTFYVDPVCKDKHDESDHGGVKDTIGDLVDDAGNKIGDTIDDVEDKIHETKDDVEDSVEGKKAGDD